MDGHILAIIPTSCHVSLDTLLMWLQQPAGLATEAEVATVFADCALGARPILNARVERARPAHAYAPYLSGGVPPARRAMATGHWTECMLTCGSQIGRQMRRRADASGRPKGNATWQL